LGNPDLALGRTGGGQPPGDKDHMAVSRLPT
jgi:hypothetical protein